MIPHIPPRPDLGSGLEALAPLVPEASGRPRSTWGWWEALGVYFLGLIAAGFAVIPLASVLGTTAVGGAVGRSEIIETIALDVLITAALVFWLARWHREWRGAIVLLPLRSWRDLLMGAVGGVALVPAVGIVSALLQVALQSGLGHKVTTPDQVAPGLSVSAKAALVVLACVVAPLSEELFFRGILFRTVRDRHGFWAAALASAVPFGFAHYVQAPFANVLLLMMTMVATGIGLAWIYDRRKTLAANILAHMTFNVIGVVMILAGGK